MRSYRSSPVGRSPKSNSAGVSKSMKANRASGGRLEAEMSRLLRRPMSRNDLPGSPDFIYPRKNIAVFVHGCFWHRCPECSFDLPKRNRSFWERKFKRNVERDRLVKRELESMGWRVLVVWEHELKNEPQRIAEKVRVFCGASVRVRG